MELSRVALAKVQGAVELKVYCYVFFNKLQEDNTFIIEKADFYDMSSTYHVSKTSAVRGLRNLVEKKVFTRIKKGKYQLLIL